MSGADKPLLFGPNNLPMLDVKVDKDSQKEWPVGDIKGPPLPDEPEVWADAMRRVPQTVTMNMTPPLAILAWMALSKTYREFDARLRTLEKEIEGLSGRKRLEKNVESNHRRLEELERRLGVKG